MITEQISVRVSPEQRDKLNAVFGDIPQKQILEALVSAYGQQPDNSVFTDKIAALEAENSRLQDENKNLLQDDKTLAIGFNDVKNENIELHRQNADLQSQNAELNKTIDALSPVVNPEILHFTVPQPHRDLLNETAKRLNTKPENILLDMFLRYTAEQWHSWFYDFCIAPSEFKAVCGYSQSEIKNYLKKVDAQ